MGSWSPLSNSCRRRADSRGDGWHTKGHQCAGCMRTIEIVLKVFSRDAKGGECLPGCWEWTFEISGLNGMYVSMEIIPLCEQRVHVVPYCSGIDGLSGAWGLSAGTRGYPRAMKKGCDAETDLNVLECLLDVTPSHSPWKTIFNSPK